MLIEASGIYLQRRVGMKDKVIVREIDNQIGLIFLAKEPLNREFQTYKL